MTRAEIAPGLAAVRTLLQEEWADFSKIPVVDALTAEGKPAPLAGNGKPVPNAIRA